jgi:hypothetical protein
LVCVWGGFAQGHQVRDTLFTHKLYKLINYAQRREVRDTLCTR